jgi:hypothetical protein
MKAILEFNMDEPEDREEHLRCTKSLDMALVLWDMDQFLRQLYRGKIERPEKPLDEFIIDRWREILLDHQIDIDRIVT